MANIATNIIQIHFLNNPSVEFKVAAMQPFFETFDCYSEISELNQTLEEHNAINFEFGSKWSEPTEELQEFCNKNNCNIIGVCHEWGCSYVSSFELSPEIYIQSDER